MTFWGFRTHFEDAFVDSYISHLHKIWNDSTKSSFLRNKLNLLILRAWKITSLTFLCQEDWETLRNAYDNGALIDPEKRSIDVQSLIDKFIPPTFRNRRSWIIRRMKSLERSIMYNHDIIYECRVEMKMYSEHGNLGQVTACKNAIRAYSNAIKSYNTERMACYELLHATTPPGVDMEHAILRPPRLIKEYHEESQEELSNETPLKVSSLEIPVIQILL